VTEQKLSSLLQSSTDSLTNGLVNCSEDGSLRSELEDLKNTLTQTKLVLEDRERRITNQENQIYALMKQVNSLKEVVAITKDMLNIRNMEVKHLQEDVDKMETKITAEREKHNAMLGKMDVAVRLNADLKKEYQTQLQLFQDLRGKYEEKVTILSEENKALEMAIQAQPAQ
jgi:chromosome segregation ATPase